MDKNRYLWTHRLNSHQLLLYVILHCLIDVFILFLSIPLIIGSVKELQSGTLDSNGLYALTLYICINLIGWMHVFHATRYGIMQYTTKYMSTESHIIFEHWLMGHRRQELPISKITDIFKLPYDSNNLHALLIVTQDPCDIRGFDFEKSEYRDWPSIEGLTHSDLIIELIKKLKKAQIHESLSHGANIAVPAKLPARKAFARIYQFTGVIYLILCLAFLIYTIDAKVLPNRVIHDNVQIARRVLDYEGTEIGAVQLTSDGFCFGTNRLMAAQGSQVTLKLSPLFHTVTDVIQNNVSYRDELATGVNGVNAYVYFITFFVLLGSGMIMVKKQGNLTNEELLIFYIAPFGFLTLSIIFGSVFW